LLIDVGILIGDALRTVLLGFFIGHIVEISIATACAGSSVAC
jgi:hypothetical protein